MNIRRRKKLRIRVQRDRDGLSQEERAAQYDLPFDQYQPIEIKAQKQDSEQPKDERSRV